MKYFSRQKFLRFAQIPLVNSLACVIWLSLLPFMLCLLAHGDAPCWGTYTNPSSSSCIMNTVRLSCEEEMTP